MDALVAVFFFVIAFIAFFTIMGSRSDIKANGTPKYQFQRPIKPTPPNYLPPRVPPPPPPPSGLPASGQKWEYCKHCRSKNATNNPYCSQCGAPL
jgi:hypothetical protein